MGCIKGKKAQLTVFIIIGIIIIAGAAIFFFLSQRTAQIDETAVEDVPIEVRPVQEFIQNCINRAGIEAFKKIGQHGGYIDPFDSEITQRSFNIDVLEPTESDGFSITDDEKNSMVYWWYMVTPNNCQDCIASNRNIPTVQDIEQQVNMYIEANLDSCLNGFKNFETTGMTIIPTGERTIKTVIAEKDILITMQQDYDVSIGDRSTKITRFVTRVPLRFKEIYNLAKEIAKAEAKNAFVEDVILHFISMATGLDRTKLPPYYATETSFVERTWIKSIVNRQLTSILVSRIPRIRFANTKNGAASPVLAEYDAGTSNKTLRQELNASYPDFSVTFSYLNQPTYFEITPSEGQRLTAAQRVPRELNFMGKVSYGTLNYQNYYEFFYDYSFPVMVEIASTTDLRGESYSFRFGIEGNIRDNRDLRDWVEGRGTYGPWDYELVQLGKNEEIAQEENNLGSPFVRQPTKSLFCNKNQRLSGLTNITTEWINETPVEGINVKYGCGHLPACNVGRTKLNDDGESVLETRLPLCFGGGYLEFEREGVLSKVIPDITTELNESQDFKVKLQQIYVKNVSVKKQKLKRDVIYRDPILEYHDNYEKDLLLADVVPIDDIDQIIIVVSRIEDNFLENLGEQSVVFDPTIDEPELRKIELVPGTYKVTGINLREEKITIEPEFRCQTKMNKILLVPEYSCFWNPQPPGIEMDVFLSGGFNLDENSSYWIVTESALKQGEGVEFTTFELPYPDVVEDSSDTVDGYDLNSIYRDVIEPKIY